MASTDVTYLYFKRDHGDDRAFDDDSSSPVIQSTRIIRHGATGMSSRAGSVPPAHLRAGSVPPRSARAGSVAPRGAVVFATATPTRKLLNASSSVRSIVYHPPHQGTSGPALLTARGVTANSIGRTETNGNTISRAPASRRGVNNRRASITVVTATPAELQQRGRQARDQLIYRADDFASGARNGSSISAGSRIFDDIRSPSASVATRSFRSSGEPSTLIHSRRRASVCGPLTSRPVSAYSKADLSNSNDDNITRSTYKSTISVNGDIEKPPRKPVADHFESSPQKESISGLRVRMNQAREQLSQHRVLLDRYLPFSLEPSNDVQYEVENKVNELAYRIPQLDPNRSIRRAANEDPVSMHLIPPYNPLPPRPTKIDVSPALPPLRSSFTPKMSDTRKRARQVLCKVHGDPRYFDF